MHFNTKISKSSYCSLTYEKSIIWNETCMRGIKNLGKILPIFGTYNTCRDMKNIASYNKCIYEINAKTKLECIRKIVSVGILSFNNFCRAVFQGQSNILSTQIISNMHFNTKYLLLFHFKTYQFQTLEY